MTCRLTLSSGLRIFAGLCLWRLPEPDELKITCGKLASGEVCYGELIESGLPDEKPDCVVAMDDEEIIVNGVTYRRVA